MKIFDYSTVLVSFTVPIYKDVAVGRAGPYKCGEAAFVFPLQAKGKFSPLRGENQGLAPTFNYT